MWQLAYTEVVVTPRLWPEFGAEQLHEAFAEFETRTRRFGAEKPEPDMEPEGGSALM